MAALSDRARRDPAAGVASLIAAALARAQEFLLEPADKAEPRAPVLAPVPVETSEALQVVVTGLSRGSGATTVAAGLAHALVVPGLRSAHLISIGDGAAPPCPPGVERWELPAALSDSREIADYAATLARLAAGGGQAALVWDARADRVDSAAGVMSASEAVVCVAEGSAEPSLCALVCDMLRERYGRVLLVANRAADPDAWRGCSAVALPDARLAALLLGRGRKPARPLAEPLARLAALVDGASD
jgi:hypothetical protein